MRPEPRLRRSQRSSMPLLAALLAMFVALGAVLVSQPFDAWTPVFSGGDGNELPVGDHALPTEDRRRDPVSRSARALRRPLEMLRRLRRSTDHTTRRTHDCKPTGPLHFASGGRARSRPAPDRAPPRPIAA
jgi:hypothetical protein